MHIALATDIPALGPGGLEVLVRELVSGLSEHHRITLATADGPDEIASSPLANHLDGFVPVPPGSSDEHDPGMLARELKARGVEVCHFHLTGTYGWRSGSRRHSPILPVHAAGIRCFTTNHQAVSPLDLSRASEPVWKRLASYLRKYPGKMACLSAVDMEFLVSDHDLETARKWHPRCKSKMQRMYHSALSGSPPQEALPHSKVILNLSTVCYRKGQHVLTKAFAKVADDHPGWKLRLVGQAVQAPCVEEILATAASHGIEDRIELAGPTHDPVNAIRQAEIYVQPSLLEGLGLSLQEALFHGRACMGSRIGGIPELIDHGKNGFLFPADDPDSLAALLSELMADRAMRETLSATGYDSLRTKGMTSEAMIEHYLGVYRQIH